MRTLLPLLLLLMWCSASCQEGADPDLLPEKDLIRLVADAHFVEAALQNVKKEQLDSVSTVYYNQLYEIHGISEETFQKNINYLKAHPGLAAKIYDQVVEEIGNIDVER